MTDLQTALHVFGYVPEDDAWAVDGRRTYSHDDDADLDFVRVFSGVLSRCGFDRHPNKLRTFVHFATGEVIEIESGGEADGHLLHHMKAEVVA
jgi:hypothetical protein